MINKKDLKTIAKKIGKITAVYDLETTSADSATTDTVQFGGIKLYPDGTVKTLELMIKPGHPITEGAEKVHGISNEKVASCKMFVDHAPEIHDFFKDAEVVGGYNIIRFDIKIINRQLTDAGFKDVFDGKHIHDIYTLYCQQHRRKLGDACEFYLKRPIEKAHSAIGDVETSLLCLDKQLDIEQKPIDQIKVEDKSDIDRYVKYEKGMPFVNFGKHKGKSFAEVDPSYFEWILKSDFIKEFKEVIVVWKTQQTTKKVK